MSWTWLVFVGVIASCKSGSKPDMAKAGSADLTRNRAPIAVPTTPSIETPHPALPEVVPEEAGPALTIEEQFKEEDIDRAWKTKTEADLGRRLASVPNVKDIECHQTQCRLVIAGSDHEVGKAIDALESDRSLHELARNVILTAPTKRTDGTIELHAFAQITRED